MLGSLPVRLPGATAGGVQSFGPFESDFGAAIAAAGARVDVVWGTPDGLFHVLADAGDGFQAPRRLPIANSETLVDDDPRLVNFGSYHLLLYGLRKQRFAIAPNENAAAPTAVGPLLEPDDPLLGHCDAAGDGGERLILACAKPRHGLQVVIAAPTGPIASRQLLWSPQEGSEHSFARPSLLLTKRGIHVLWSIYAMTSEDGASRLLHFFSPDNGRTWQQETLPLGEQGRGRMVTEIVLLADDARLWLAYVGAGGLYVRSTEGSVGGWTQAVKVTNQPHIARVGGVSANTPILLWVDARYREQQWWGHVPFHQLFRPNTSPFWRNNDVFALRLSRGAETERDPIRLTEPLSYTDPHRRYRLRAIATGGWLYVLREGRRKVGYELDQFNAQPELFIHRVPVEAIP